MRAASSCTIWPRIRVRQKTSPPNAVDEAESAGQHVAGWREEFPPPEVAPEGPSDEDVRALRSLGYVD